MLHIVQQVRALYQKYGIKSVTMDDVAKHLAVSKKTLYEYFNDKEDLVSQVLLLEDEERLKCHREVSGKQLNAIEEMFEVYKLILESFRSFNQSMSFDIRKYYPELWQRHSDVRRQRLYEAAFDNITKGKREGLYREELDSAIIAKLHVFKAEMMSDDTIFSQQELTSVTVFREIFLLHIYGILNENGREQFKPFLEKMQSGLDLQ